MKRNLRLIMVLLLLVTATSLQAQVAINADGSNPDASAMLDVKSAAKGALLPRIPDTADVVGPVTGLIVFQTKDNSFYFFDENIISGGAWSRLIAEGPMGIVLNGMLDVHGSIKNTSANNNGRVVIEDADGLTLDGAAINTTGNGPVIIDDGQGLRILSNLGVNGAARIDGAITANGGDVNIADDATVDGNLNVTGGIRNIGDANSYVLVDDAMGLRIENGLDAQGGIENSTGANFGRVLIQDALTLDGGGLAATGGPVIIDDGQGLRVEQDLGVNGNARIDGNIFSTAGDVDIDDDVEISGDLSVTGMITNDDGGMLQLTDVGGVTIETGIGTFADVNIQGDDVNITASGAGGPDDITLTADNIIAVGNVMGFSDERFKDKIQPIDGAISKIAQLSGYTYFWNGLKKELTSKNKQYGVLAQEVEALFPDLVITNEEGYKAVNYTGLIPVLIQATNEQNEKVDAQQKEIDELKAELQSLKAMLLKQMENNK